MSESKQHVAWLYESAYYDDCDFKPLIGVVLDYVDIKSSDDSFVYSEYPWYALGKRYCDCIVRAGGVPVPLCYNLSNINKYAEILDGLLLSGTGFDIEPVFYGEKAKHKTTITKPIRTQFEFAITKKMLDKNKPVFGINAGMQIINVILGGNLIQHLLEEVPNSIYHTQDIPMTLPYHWVEIFKDTMLYEITENFDKVYAASLKKDGTDSLFVKTGSYHHQGIKKLGEALKINAVTEDGVIECIEAIDFDFCIGVQWNSEFQINRIDVALFDALIKSSRNSHYCS